MITNNDNIDDKNIDDKNIDDKNIDDKNIHDKNINDKNINDKNIDDKNIDSNNLIIKKLDKLCLSNNIPNIIFHGSNLSGKKKYLSYLLKKLYINNENIEKYTLTINCSHGKGNIKFIRDNLKTFANTIINSISKKDSNGLFKSIILLNADKLTFDAQSALRRCIEIYNHSTRFFIVVENKCNILKPILSRFSEIYCNNNKLNNKINNIYNFDLKKLYHLNKILNLDNDNIINIDIVIFANKLYNMGYSGNLIIKFITNKMIDNKSKYKFLFIIDIYKKEIRNEVLIIIFCLNYIYFRNIIDYKNINFI